MKKILTALVLSLLTLCLFSGCTEPGGGSKTEEETTVVECQEHNYDDGVVTREPTCSTTGIKTFTCTVCKHVREEEVPKNDVHSYGDASVTLDPTCTEAGECVYACIDCGAEKTETMPAKGHALGDWTVITEPTFNEIGIERAECVDCDYYEEREIEKLASTFIITIDKGDGELLEFGVGEDGAYVLETPEKIGYNFIRWIDADGNEFPAEGKISANVQIKAIWELDGTDNLAELIERAGAGVDVIKITADITVTEPIFFVGKTSIYADEDHTIKRSPDYAGDMFVIGQDKDGISSIILQKETVLSIGGGKGTLTIDGNRDLLEVKVLGSALYISDSAIVNLHEGIVIANHMKLGNERTFTCGGFVSETTMLRAGGAAILLMNGVVNMYGGVIENNLVATEYTVETAADGTETRLENFGCGGAIYNRGNFNMYGGLIRNNEGLRGGAIYNDEIVLLVSGTISGNISHSYGGAVSSSSAAEAQMFIGSTGESDKVMLFEGNHSKKAGGVLYSSTSSPIVIYGNTVFNNNSTESSGGAIYTGGALTLRSATFTGNSSSYSGGAIYLHYPNPDFVRREMEIIDCVFDGNMASLGGAVTLSASDKCTEQGTYAVITNCSFKNNQAQQSEIQAGNGGAMYITRKSEAKIKDCEFIGNTASTNAGALSIHSEAQVTLDNITFKDNTAAFGGALYSSSNSVVALNHIDFNGNKAILKESGSGGNGGAIFVQSANITLKNVSLTDNTAENNAGAIYQCGITVSVDETVSFKNNSATNYGGAVYVTYLKNEDETRTGGRFVAVGATFENNTALAGGAIGARSDSVVELTDVSFKNNSTPDALSGTGNGGGALYCNNSSVKLTNVVMDGNMSGYYGGAIKADACDVTVNNLQVLNSSGGTGGAIYASGGTFEADQLILTNNVSSFNGVVYFTRNTVTFKDVTAVGNVAVNGGVFYTSANAEVSIESSQFNGNDSRKGGVLCVSGESTVTVKNTTFEGNSATEGNGGAIYVFGANLNLGRKVKFIGNSADLHGGAVYITDYTYTPEAASGNEGENNDEGGEAVQPEPVIVKSTFIVDGTSFNNNKALRGGAIYVAKNEYSIKNAEFVENHAEDLEYGGGAIYNTEAVADLDNVTLTNNFSHKGGAIALHSTSNMTVSSITATGNKADLNSAGEIGLGGVFYVNNSTLSLVEGEGKTISLGGEGSSGNKAENGGVIYADNGAEVILSGVSFSGNQATNGGAMYVTGGAGLVADNCEFIGNKSTNNAGALSVHSRADIKLTGVKFSNNTAPSGGAVFVSTGTTVSFDSVEFEGNKAIADPEGRGGNGGAVYAQVATLTLKNTNFTNNAADNNAGALYISAMAVELDATVAFTGNFAKNHGGAVYAVYKNNDDETRTGAHLTAVGTLFENNTALSGGAISARSESIIELTDVSFKNNTTPDALSGTGNGGGAIYANNAELKLCDVVMDGNASGYYGGAIKSDYCGIEIKSTQVLNNQGGTGGAIYATGSTLIADELILTGNKSALNGVVYLTGTEATFTKLQASSNEAVNGGVIYASSEANVRITESECFENTATKGGAVYAVNSVVEIGEITTFATNTAKNGGAIYATESASITLNAVVLQNNTAISNGGAITVEGATVTVLANTVFDGNTAGNFGGAVSVHDFVETVMVTPEGATEPVEETVTVKSNVTVDGASFKNNSALQGGAIYVAKNSYTIGNTEFANNTATASNYGGGAIYNTGATGEINNVKFVGNTSHKGGAVALHSESHMTVTSMIATGNNATLNEESKLGVGGVFYANNSTLDLVEGEGDAILFGSAAEGNVAVDGGVIYAENNAVVTIVAAEFIGNSASHYGGAIYAKESEIAISGDTTVFNANTSENLGGAIFVTGSDVELTDVEMSENSATVNGGALYVTSSNVTIIGGSFTKNEAVLGGAIYAVADAQITVENVEFSENTASNNGGAISAANADLIISGDNTLFNANTATNHGGAIYLSYQTIEEVQHGSTLNMTSGLFSGNTAVAGGAISGRTNSDITLTGVSLTNNSTPGATSKSGGGGAIYVNTCKLTVTGVTLNGNSSGYYGGALRADSSATVYINGNSVISNNMGTTGAALYFSSSSLEAENVTIENNNAEQNTNGTVYFNGGAHILNNITATGNKANTGGVFDLNKATVTMSSIVAKDNEANLGGVIYARMSTLEIADSTFENNKSTTNGGAISLAGTTLDISGESVFKENSAAGHAGAVYVSYYEEKEGSELIKKWSGILTVIGASFENNTAMGGGAISIRTSCEADITDSEFINNSVSGFADENDGNGEGGGAIYVGYGSLTLNNVTMTGNTAADGFGGAVNACDSTVTVNGGSFDNNTSMGGGAVNVLDNSNVTFNVTYFNSNVALGEANTLGGGAINSASSDLTVSGVTMDDNSSTYYGGAINARKGTVVIENSVIKNTQGGTGAALYFREAGTVVTLTDITLTDNVSTANGIIYMTNAGTLTVDGLIATANSAHQGGVFYVSGGVITLNNVTATENNADNGGVLYVGGASVTVNDSTFDSNTAKLGGAIYTTSGSITVLETDILNNIATEFGGAAYVAGGNLTFGEGTEVNRNTAVNGGAIYAAENATVEVIGAAFGENEAAKGGAIFATKNSAVTVKGASFTGNSASYGGAIFAEGTTLDVGSDEAGNKTLFENNAATGYGGALYINEYSFTPEVAEGEPTPETEIVKTTLSVNGAVFEINTALRGGAIYLAKTEGYTLEKTEFVSNSATEENYGGGAIYSTESVGTLDEITFIGNTSHKGGAVALHSTSEMTVTSMTATGNSATVNSESGLGVGGVFYANNSTLALVAGENKTIILGASVADDANTAVNGGAIYAENGSELIITNAIFEGNSATNHGGAIDAIAAKVTIIGDETLFKNNSAVKHGGAIYASYSNSVYTVIEMTGGRFEGNTAMAGGAVSIRSGCEATFTDTVFDGNSVAGDDGTADGNGEGGGAIYQGYGKLNLVNVVMTNNTAEVYGGAIVAVGGTVTATGGEFKNNTAARGGAINALESTMSFTDTKFTANQATEYNSANGGKDGGGAINAEEGRLTLSGVVMDGNTSKYYGGAINARKGTVEIKNGTVITNSQGGTGAALYFREAGTTVIINDSTVSDNTSTANGVIYMTSAGTLTVDGLVASGNSAVNGGVFYLSGGTATFSSVVATDNVAKTNGNLLNISGSAVATVNYETDAEKAVWEDNTYQTNTVTVTYVAKGNQ